MRSGRKAMHRKTESLDDTGVASSAAPATPDTAPTQTSGALGELPECNQPVNQPTNQPANQPVNQPTNQPTPEEQSAAADKGRRKKQHQDDADADSDYEI